MANITAQMVKELRERSGAGMMDCKAALQETGGDMEEAHVLTIRADGKVTNLWDLPSDPEVHDRFFDGK